MRNALLAVVAACLLGGVVLLQLVRTKTEIDVPACAVEPLDASGTRIAALEAEVARLARELERLRFEVDAAPDAIPDQDHPNAWASLVPDGGRQWLELRYPPRRAAALRIHEVCVAGAAAEVVLIDESGGEHVVWSGVDPTARPGVFEVAFATTVYRVAAVRLVLDTDRASGWSEIDAVELVGPDGNAWATGASASSWFGGG